MKGMVEMYRKQFKQTEEVVEHTEYMLRIIREKYIKLILNCNEKIEKSEWKELKKKIKGIMERMENDMEMIEGGTYE